jgi:2-C-methyl-D-erythritol 4-phosphate cytidylyltransferase
MQGAVGDKVLARLAGRPVFSHSAAAFVTSGVADLYVVVYRDRRQMLELSAHAPTPFILVPGGAERQDSVVQALHALPDDIAYVFIHDCARPLILPEQLRALHQMVRREGAAVLAHRVTDTIKERQSRSLARGGTGGMPKARLRTIERARLWAMETPQAFARDLIDRGYARVQKQRLKVTDDAAAVEQLGRSIALLENPHPNPKLTAPADLAYLEFLLSQRAP